MGVGLKLAAVIELNASAFAKEEYPYPDRSRFDDPEGWNLYWLRCLRDSDLYKVRAIEPGSNLVDILHIDQDELEIILRKELEIDKSTGLENGFDEILTFEGGVYVRYGKHEVEPQCCTSLADYLGWEDFLKKQPSDWTELWIGHPWIFARCINGSIEFSGYHEYSEHNGIPEFSIHLESFEKHFEQTLVNIDTFTSRVSMALKGIGIVQHEQLADYLVKKEEPQ